jgi:hypothetical protein
MYSTSMVHIIISDAIFSLKIVQYYAVNIIVSRAHYF